MVLHKVSRLLLRIIASIVLLLAIAWAAAALWIDAAGDFIPSDLLAGAVVLVAIVIAVFVRPWWRMAVSILVVFLVVLGWWLALPPSNERDWQADVARFDLPSVGTTVVNPRWSEPRFFNRAQDDYRILDLTAGQRFSSPSSDAAYAVHAP